MPMIKDFFTVFLLSCKNKTSDLGGSIRLLCTQGAEIIECFQSIRRVALPAKKIVKRPSKVLTFHSFFFVVSEYFHCAEQTECWRSIKNVIHSSHFSVILAKKTAVRSCFLRNIAKSLILI